MRVAILSPCFWPEVRRGTERFARELADGLIARGHEPRLLTSHRGRPSHAVEDGLPVIRHWRPPEGPLRLLRAEDHLLHAPLSYRSLRRGADDVAQALFVTDALAAARWSRRTGKPSIFSYMGIPDRLGLRWRRGRRRLTERAVTECTAVTALSRVAADEFRRELGVEARVIHPGVSLESFRPVGERAAEPTFFSSADITEPRKRIGLLVEAVRRLRADLPGARLVLSRPRDAEAAGRFEAENPDVELASVDDEQELARAYSKASVTVLPSLGEAFGLVLVESLACGTPVVATDSGGMREVVDSDGVGRLFDGERPEDLARVLREALELTGDPLVRERCRQRADAFSTDRCIEAYLDLYRELVSASPGA